MEVAARGGGLFGFEELSSVAEDGRTFRPPTHGSGLYDNLEAAG